MISDSLAQSFAHSGRHSNQDRQRDLGTWHRKVQVATDYRRIRTAALDRRQQSSLRAFDVARQFG
jgi:hypothetical protein